MSRKIHITDVALRDGRTSTETLRHHGEETGGHGDPHAHNEQKADEISRQMTGDTGAEGDMTDPMVTARALARVVAETGVRTVLFDLTSDIGNREIIQHHRLLISSLQHRLNWPVISGSGRQRLRILLKRQTFGEQRFIVSENCHGVPCRD